jgi:MSHA biogenesis protein MshQ
MSRIKFLLPFYLLMIIMVSGFSHSAFAVQVSVRLSADNDDAEERVSDGDMYRDSTDLELGYDGFVGGLQFVGMRFRSVNIPQGATINSAYIEFEADETDAGTTNLIIYGDADDSPNQFANNAGNISGRNKTTASVSWSPSAWNSENDLHQTADIAPIIQEIVNRSGWVANNNLAIIVAPGTGCSSSSCQRTAESHDGESGSAPLLVVNYSEGNFSGSLNVDNAFSAYISTDDAVQGTLIGSGTNWPTTIDISTTLTPGQTYYLHIYATDAGGVAGFLGNFELTGSDHTFSNGLNSLNTNTSDWRVSTSGWSNYQAASGYGTNGVSPWGTQSAVNSNAVWIWSANNDSDNVNYFSTTISAVLPPIPPEIANTGGSCAALSAVTIVFTEDVEQTSAETVANYQVLMPSGVFININSAVRTSANTVTLSLANFLNDLTDYTVIINNVQDLHGDTIVADSSDTFSLACNLNCINDSFLGPGALSASWSSSSSSGSFGAPRILENGRLRLTDASGQVATVATLLNQFPGSDNKIEVEFDLYAYGGSGADGIVVTFSDASIPPVPGSYGGALGYAQRSGGGVGFAGGWLGVGLDEYGNFANPNEGKDGGSGFEQDSVALRGSGSGTNGYPYLTSTGSLSPGIDQSGSTPNPGHRYKITVDHTMGGGQAFVTVERDTGSGYVAVIPRFDIFAVNPSQAAVPDNWVVSFTGSTGGATNIHEMGALQVCAAQPISSYGSPDHYEISHASAGITCEGSQVTVIAHDASHNAFDVSNNTNLTVSTSPAVDTIVPSSITIPAGSSSTSFFIQQSSVLSNIDIDVTDGTATDVDGDTSGEDPLLSFSDTAFRFYANGVANDISKQVAGVNTAGQNLNLRAIKTDDETGACVPALEGPTPTNVDIAYECNSPTTCSSNDLLSFEGLSLTGDDQGNGPSYVSVPMVFDSNGEADFDFSFVDAGQITLRAQKSLAANDPDPAFTLSGTSNAFWVRPFELELSAQSSGIDINGTSSNSATTHKAGDPFDLIVRAVNASGGVTPNYRPGQLQFQLTRTGPTVGSEGILTYTGSGSLTSALAGFSGFQNVTLETFVGGALGNGISQFTGASYSEVGLINLDVQDVNYGGPLDPIPGDAFNIGRFTPHHFNVTAITNGTFADACGSFTYLGQSFTYGASSAPSLSIMAENADNQTTENYTDSDYQKLVANDIIRVFPNQDGVVLGKDGLAPMSVTSSPAVPNGFVSVGSAGQSIFTFNSNDSYSYDKDANAEVVPFNNGQLTIATTSIEDSDSVAANNLLTSLDITPTSASIRYGRWVMENTFGPETNNLAMNANMEYLNASGFYVPNVLDNCTQMVVTAATGTAGAGVIAGIAVGSSTSDLTYNSTLINGEGGLLFTAPGSDNSGSILLNVDHSAQTWLQYDWNGDGTLQNHPGATATFGQYRGHDRIIYWREVSN